MNLPTASRKPLQTNDLPDCGAMPSTLTSKLTESTSRPNLISTMRSETSSSDLKKFSLNTSNSPRSTPLSVTQMFW